MSCRTLMGDVAAECLNAALFNCELFIFHYYIYQRHNSDKTIPVYANILLIFPFQMTLCNCLLPTYILQLSHELYSRSLSLSYTSEWQVSGTSLSAVYKMILLFRMKDCFYENVKNSVTSLTSKTNKNASAWRKRWVTKIEIVLETIFQDVLLLQGKKYSLYNIYARHAMCFTFTL